MHFRCDDDAWLQWRTSEVTVAGRTLDLVSKPGVPGFGERDPSEELLLDNLDIAATDTICSLHCGTGGPAALAALLAPRGRVLMFDDNLVAVEAARRTLQANDVANASVTFGIDAQQLRACSADVVLARLPKGKLPALQVIWHAFHALRPGGRLCLAGGNEEGIKPAIRHMQQLFGSAGVAAYGGGHRLATAIRPDAPAARAGVFDIPWLDEDRFQHFPVTVHERTFEVFSRPGVFSWDGLDDGTQALLDVLDVKDCARILDLGCGAGVVGVGAALQAPAARITMVDVSAEAVRSSMKTVSANGLNARCEVISSDVAGAIADGLYDAVLTNPPFHTARATDLDVPAQFIRDARRVLAPGGKLYLVANRTLPYEAWLERCFGSYSTVRDGHSFKVLSAVRTR